MGGGSVPDVRNWKTNYNKTAGCTQIEIDGFNSQLNPKQGSGHNKLIDVWRRKLHFVCWRSLLLWIMWRSDCGPLCCSDLHPDTVGVYSYYSYRFQAREKGLGWRLDSFLVRPLAALGLKPGL